MFRAYEKCGLDESDNFFFRYSFMLGYGFYNCIQCTNTQGLVVWNGDSMSRWIFGF